MNDRTAIENIERPWHRAVVIAPYRPADQPKATIVQVSVAKVAL